MKNYQHISDMYNLFFGCLSANPFVLVLEGRASYMCRYELMGEVP